MRFRIEASFEGDALVNDQVLGSIDGFDVELIADPETGAVTRIAITTNADDILPALGAVRPQGSEHKLRIPPAPRFKEMVAILQHIESVGSFWLGCERIGWNEPEGHWLSASPEEAALLDMTRFAARREYDRMPRKVTGRLLQYVLDTRTSLSRYLIPLSFYREGMREHRAKRYLLAFFQFYFYLEDLYAEGRFKSAAVEKLFRASTTLRQAAAYALEQLNEPRSADQAARIRALMARVKCDMTPEGVLSFIVRMRGHLHHYSSKGTEPRGHPLNQEEYQPVSALLLVVCTTLIADQMPPRSWDPVEPGNPEER